MPMVLGGKQWKQGVMLTNDKTIWTRVLALHGKNTNITFNVKWGKPNHIKAKELKCKNFNIYYRSKQLGMVMYKKMITIPFYQEYRFLQLTMENMNQPHPHLSLSTSISLYVRTSIPYPHLGMVWVLQHEE